MPPLAQKVRCGTAQHFSFFPIQYWFYLTGYGLLAHFLQIEICRLPICSQKRAVSIPGNVSVFHRDSKASRKSKLFRTRDTVLSCLMRWDFLSITVPGQGPRVVTGTHISGHCTVETYSHTILSILIAINNYTDPYFLRTMSCQKPNPSLAFRRKKKIHIFLFLASYNQYPNDQSY